MFTRHMHGPIPRILEPTNVDTNNYRTSSSSSHNPSVQFFPGDVYTTFQTTVSTPVVGAATANPHQLALPSPYSSPWNTVRGPKFRPPRSTAPRKYPAITFSAPTNGAGTAPPRNFFRPVTSSSLHVNGAGGGYLTTGRPSAGFRSTSSTPPVVVTGGGGGALTDLVNPFLLVAQEPSSSYSQRRHSTPGVGIAPYFVDLHVGTGSAVQVHNGPETHIIAGPASVTIMSNCSNPPTAIPVTVPPGQYVQQLMDDHGVLRSVYISNQPYAEGALDNFQHNYYVPAQMQLQMPIHNAATFPTQFPIPTSSNGMHQPNNGFAAAQQQQQSSPYASQEFHGFSPQQQQQAIDNRDYAARQKLKKKFENKKRPPVNPNRRFPDYDNGLHKNHDTAPLMYNGDRLAENGSGDAGSHSGCASVSPPIVNGGGGGGVEREDDVLVNFFSAIKPVLVDNINANSVTITCNPLDFTQLDVTQLDKYADVKETDWVYFVLCGEGSEKPRSFTAGTAPQLTLQLVELRPNTEYRVCAQVGYGDLKGKQSESVTFRTAKAQPEPPEAARLIRQTKNSLEVKWLPRCDNGAKILRYIVEHDQGHSQGDDASWTECYRGNDKQAKITRLAPDTTYRIRIFAENDVGLSAPSPVVALRTAGLPPGQPDPPRVSEVSAHMIKVEWKKRAGDEAFILQLEDPMSGHGFIVQYAGPDTYCWCKELTRVTDYKVRLAVDNHESSQGTSPFSNIISVTTRAELPHSPSKPTVKGKVSPHSFRAQWDPPSDTGGEAITKYRVECTGTAGLPQLDHNDTDTYVLVKNVEPGQTYFVRVFASNSVGEGPHSEVCMVHTPPVAPGVPLPPYMVGKAKATGVALRWEPPVSSGGESVANYELKKIMFYDGYSAENDGVVVYYGSARENHVEGLSPGKVYLFLVRAYNSIGPGPWSEVTEVETGPGPPDAPETLRLQAKNANCILASWKEPWSNGAPVTEYKLEMAETENSSEQSFVTVYTGSKLTHEVKNLKSNSEYFFRLAATNSAGNGPCSPLHSCWTPPACPCAVDADTITHLVSPTAITLSWEVPEDNGSPVTGYKVEFDQQIRVVDQPVAQCLLDGLRPDSVYKIRIQATNSIGDGAFSSFIKVKTKPVVPDVPKLEVQAVSHGSVKVKWSSVAKSDVEVEYVLEMAFNKKDVFQTVYRGNQISHKLNKVREDTIYFFRVRSVNEAGDSPQSEIVECRTPKSPPPAVKAPKIVPSEDFCLVQWPKLPQCEGEDISYALQSSKSGGPFLEIYKGSECQFKASKLEPGVAYQFRVKPVRVLGTRSIPGSWSPVASYTVAVPSSSSAATTSSDRSLEESKQRSTRKTFRQWFGSVDFRDERVAIGTAGACILLFVVLISSYILLSN